MRYAICNETFGTAPMDATFAQLRDMGYEGIEIAPFTLCGNSGGEEQQAIDARHVSAEQRREVVRQAAQAGLEVVGLHWLLAKTEGFYLTSPDAAVRAATIDYFHALVELCHDLGGQVMVLGSPLQRNLLPGVAYEEAEQYAAEVLRAVMPACSASGVTIAVEPLGPAEGDFLLTAASGVRLAEMVDSPNCRLHLDVKAMSSEADPIEQIIRDYADWMVHFHANDPNRLGPGMGDVDFRPIFAALRDVNYQGWVSVEAFRYEPTPLELARISIENMRRDAGE
jgi:sugar phosphate isomerase/epimerase